MGDATKLTPCKDTDHAMATEAKDNTLITSTEQEPASLMTLPPELRLDILERVVSLDLSRIVEISESGEQLFELWSRLMRHGSQFAGCEETFPRQWDAGLNWGSNKAERYTCQPRIADVLQSNKTLQKEGRDVYQRFAKLQIAAYKAEQEDFPAKFGHIIKRYNEVEPWGPGLSEVARKLHLDLEEELRGLLVGMAERGLRWHALKQVCEVLDQPL